MKYINEYSEIIKQASRTFELNNSFVLSRKYKSWKVFGVNTVTK